MKDMSLKVKYFHTDTGCIIIWVHHGSKLLSCETVFADESLWFESHQKPKCTLLQEIKNVETP